MARTKASVGAKVSAGKSNKARCSVAPPPKASSTPGTSKSTRNYTGGNPVCPRETPKWQKPITSFYVSTQGSNAASTISDEELEVTAGSSKPKSKHNIIHSDEEEETELPKNHALDESLVLEPLNGETSHKINEYYTNKDKGIGKKSKKENIDLNGNRNGKRSLEEVDEGQSSKRVRTS